MAGRRAGGGAGSCAKVKVAGLRIFRENTRREAIADLYNLVRVTAAASSDYRWSPSREGVVEPFDAVVVTDLTSTRRTCEAALTRFGLERVLVPALLRQRLRDREEKSS